MSIDLDTIVKQGVSIVFDQLSQLVEKVELQSELDGEYIPSRGEVAGIKQVVTVDGILLDYKNMEDNTLQIGDKNLILKNAQLPFGISTRYTIKRSKDNTIWAIVNYKQDPTGNIYETQIRRLK